MKKFTNGILTLVTVLLLSSFTNAQDQWTTYGLFADNPDYNLSGSFIGDARAAAGGVWLNGLAFSEDIVDPAIAMEGTCWKVDFTDDGDDRVMWCVDLSDPEGAVADFSEFTGGQLVMHIKLIDKIDIRLEIIGYRIRSSNINGSDETMTAFGLDTTDTENWQEIVYDLTRGIGDDVDLFEYDQFCAFAIRSNDMAGQFYVDEVYVRIPTGTTDVGDEDYVPANFSLKQNYPNPFNPSTKISFSLTDGGYTTLKVFNLLGQQVAELVNGEMAAGNHEITFDASNLSAGTYLYQLTSGQSSEVKKMILMK